MSAPLPDMTYSVVAHDEPARLFYVVLVNAPDGDATVVSRWSSKELAEASAAEWLELERKATS